HFESDRGVARDELRKQPSWTTGVSIWVPKFVGGGCASLSLTCRRWPDEVVSVNIPVEGGDMDELIQAVYEPVNFGDLAVIHDGHVVLDLDRGGRAMDGRARFYAEERVE